MRVALTKSRNLAIVNLIDRMGIDHTRDFINKRFGYSMEDMPDSYGLALGSGSSTPLQLAAGYAVIANGGYAVKPYFITRIEDADGNVLFEVDPPHACRGCWVKTPEGEAEIMADGSSDDPLAERVLDPRIAYNMNSMMKDVIQRGTATRAKRLGRSDIAGKTGTTNESRDSWFAGFTPDLVTVAWMGMDDNRPLGRGEWGGTAALGMWVDFMADALEDVPIAEIKRPEGMVAVRVSESTGKSVKRGGIVEYIRDEYQLMTLGPDPINYAGPVVANPSARAGARRDQTKTQCPARYRQVILGDCRRETYQLAPDSGSPSRSGNPPISTGGLPQRRCRTRRQARWLFFDRSRPRTMKHAKGGE